VLLKCLFSITGSHLKATIFASGEKKTLEWKKTPEFMLKYVENVPEAGMEKAHYGGQLTTNK